MAAIGRFVREGESGSDEEIHDRTTIQSEKLDSSEIWNEQTRKLTQEIREFIPNSVDQFVAKLTNANIRVEQCNSGEASSVTTRTVITAESEEKAREKLSAVGEISINQTQNQVAIEQTDDDSVISGINMDSSGISISGNTGIHIRRALVGGTVSISGGSGGYKITVGGEDVTSSLALSGASGAMVEKREVILRVQPDSLKDYNLTTENGSVEIPQGLGKAQVKTENGKIIIGQFDGEFGAKTENGAVLIETVEGDAYIKSVNGRLEIGKVTGSVNIKTENGSLTIKEVTSDLAVVSENGRIELGEIGGTGNIKTESGAIVISKVEKDLTVVSKNGRFAVSQVLGSARIKQIGGSTSIGFVGENLIVISETGAIEVERVSGSTIAESRNGSITLGTLAKGVKVKTQTGRIEIRSVAGTMNADSTNGAVSISQCVLEGNTNNIQTGTGRVDVGIVNSAVTITAQSGTGRVECPGFAELSRIGGRGNPTKVGAAYGNTQAKDAAVLKISSQNGSITAQRV